MVHVLAEAGRPGQGELHRLIFTWQGEDGYTRAPPFGRTEGQEHKYRRTFRMYRLVRLTVHKQLAPIPMTLAPSSSSLGDCICMNMFLMR